jgi:signal peptidase I
VTAAGSSTAQLPESAAGPAPGGRGKPLWRKALEWGVILVAAAGAAFLLRAFVLEALRVPSRSMEPSLLPGDFVIVSKLPESQVKVGAVYAFRVPSGVGRGGSVFVKRCIAGPGDSVVLGDSVLLVNGVRADPPGGPAAEEMQGSPAVVRRSWVIPRRGEMIALHDSVLYLWHTLIEREGHIVTAAAGGGVLLDGKPAASYRVEQNHYFVVGDNRSESYDSRLWGLLPERALLGRVIAVYWSWDDARSAVRWGRIGTIVR